MLARQIGYREQICVLLSNLGDVLGEQGNYLQAEAYLQEGLALARQIGHREWISALLINLGLMIRKQGNYTQSEKYFQESLTLARQLGRHRLTSAALYEYGNLYLEKQQIQAAEATFRELLYFRREGDQEFLALAQYGLARVAAAQGNIEESQRLGEASISALEVMGHRNAKEVRDWLDSKSKSK
jgi:tetratricopeptide (TPR) repeat protein